jgi:hypothetical protein
MNSFVRATLALGTLLGACGAFAGSSAQATLDSLTITLIDLDPGDGVAPSISFVAGASRASAIVFQPFGVFDGDVASGSGPWSNVGASVTLSLGGAAATLQGAGADGSGASLHVSGQAADPGAPLGASVQYQAQVWAPYVAAGAFVLSPWTAVTVSAAASLSTTTQSGATSHDVAGASAYIFLEATGDVITLDCESVADQQCTAVDGRQLSVSFSNAAGTSANGTFQAWAQVSGYSQAAAVPEPAETLLMFTGLCVVGDVVRRRRRA